MYDDENYADDSYTTVSHVHCWTSHSMKAGRGSRGAAHSGK